MTRRGAQVASKGGGWAINRVVLAPARPEAITALQTPGPAAQLVWLAV